MNARRTAIDDNFGQALRSMINSCVNWRMESVVFCGGAGAVSYTQTRNHVLPLRNHIHAYKFYFVCLVFFSLFCSPILLVRLQPHEYVIEMYSQCYLVARITTNISKFRSTTKLRSHFTQTLDTHRHTLTNATRYQIWQIFEKWSMRAQKHIRRAIITYIYWHLAILCLPLN